MFGMHIGSVLSGLGIRNVKTDLKMLSLTFFGSKNSEFGGSKMSFFKMFGGLGGDFYKDTYEPMLFEMHIRSVLRGLYAENVSTDPKILI